ncbi:MAG: putative DNA-binding domain-containing protein [Acidobacteria bacterium]|nr:putative DNA-binding domain-containing protein [Acidobacteriota bacterium]
MPPLAETQSRFRDALVTGDAAGITPLLTGGRYAEKRLAIHQRHYETSLVKALLGKFPATAWLAGTPFVSEAAKRFVHEHPPQAPCIAEYGENFPRFVSECPGAGRVPYLSEFATLEWHIGHVAIAVDRPAVAIEEFSTIDGGALPDTRLSLQTGLRYLHASWPIDELMKLYLTETAPERFELSPGDVWIEVRGARGEFHFSRLDAAEFVFRKSILERRSIGDAAERALDVNAAFDPGQALGALIAAGLVHAISRGVEGEHS